MHECSFCYTFKQPTIVGLLDCKYPWEYKMYKYERYLHKSQHLSKEEFEELAQLYYSNVKHSTLIEKFGIDVSSGNLYKCFPPQNSDKECPYCKVNLVYLPISKAQSRSDHRKSVCLSCDHEYENNKCSCNGCTERKNEEAHKKKIAEQQKSESILDFLKKTRQPSIHLKDLTLRDRLYLAALLKNHLSGDLKIIKPVFEYRQALAPTREYTINMLKHLSHRGTIQLSERAHMQYSLEDNKLRYDPLHSYYDLNVISNESSKTAMIKFLLHPTPLEVHEVEDGYKLWLEIALHESMQYLKLLLEQCGLIRLALEIINEKTSIEISTYLEHFSTSQLFKILWSITNNAAAQKQKYNKSISADTLVNNIAKYCNRAIENNWEIGNYSRTYHNKQTIISSILFDQILKIGENGFIQKASRDYLGENIGNVGAACQKK